MSFPLNGEGPLDGEGCQLPLFITTCMTIIILHQIFLQLTVIQRILPQQKPRSTTTTKF